MRQVGADPVTLATAARCLARDCGWSAEGGPETDRAERAPW